MTRRRLAKLVLFFLLLIGSALTAYVYGLYHQPGPHRQTQAIHVPAGTGVSTIAGILTDENVTTYPVLFKIVTRLTGAHRGLHAGEYEIPVGASISDVVHIMSSGQTLDRYVTVIEGETVFQTINRLNDNEYLSGEVITPPEEGHILPETYQFKRGESRQEVLNRMADAMEAALKEAWDNRSSDVFLNSKEEVLTLAAIVEKETSVAAERPRIAAVFLNRLEKRMRLQADPTVIYGITHGKGALGRRLLTKDLEADHPYNTYTRHGLPAGPIANPSLAAIMAVTNPIHTNELYFVADGTGGHIFASTLKEHEKNVKRWRKIRRARR